MRLVVGTAGTEGSSASLSMMRKALVLLLGCQLLSALHAQSDWPGYGRDKGAQRYSPLTQIHTGNVAKLIPAWTFAMQREGVPFRPSLTLEAAWRSARFDLDDYAFAG